MAQRDYVSRRTGKAKKKAKQVNKSFILIIALLIMGIFVAGLFFLKEKSTEVAPIITPTTKVAPKSVLPTPPEEVWSYIKALETRTVPVDDNPTSLEKNMRLTDEQKKVLIAMEEEQKAAEVARLKQATENPNAEPAASKEVIVEKPTPTKVTEPKKTPEVVKQVESKPVEKAPSSSSDKKFGLQCGAFKNRQQAENIQAKLVLAGFNARVNSSADWNRVVVGPVGDRTTTQKALEKAKSVTACVLIGM